MDRTSAPGATPTHMYTEGNPGMGVPATTVSAIALNAFQEELVGIIEAAGITPSEADNGQVLGALGTLFAPAGGYEAVDAKVEKLATYRHAAGAISLVSGAASATVASVSCPAGTWLVEADATFQVDIGTLSAGATIAAPGEGPFGGVDRPGDRYTNLSTSVTNSSATLHRGARVVTLTTTTDLLLTGFANFTGTCELYGWITARRLDIA